MVTVRKDRAGSWRLAGTSRNAQLRLPFPGQDSVPGTFPQTTRQSQETNVTNLLHGRRVEVNHAVFPL